MTFTFAPALVLLLLLPVAAYIGFPRYGYRRTRDLTSLVLRLIILLLMILAISGAQVVRSADKLAVVFLVDVSDSIDPATQDAEFAYVAEAMESMGINDSAGIVLFGTNAVVERQVNNVRELGEIQSAPVTSNTDLAEAIRLGLALFPADAARRMVILSDGRPTVGDTEAAAGLAAATDVQIDYVLFRPERSADVQVTDVSVPTTVGADQVFDLSISIEAEEETTAEVTVYASGEIILQDDVELNEGQNRRTFSLRAGESGFRDFRVQIDPAGEDEFAQNNSLSAFSRVVGPPRVLIMATDPQEVQFIVPALEEAGLDVDLRAPDELPVGLVPLVQYDSIIIANVAARFLSNARMEAIDSYVKDLGGGLVFIGGPESYGPGGYFMTPLEDTLPVETRIRDQQRLPQLTLAYLVDTSGSMGAVGPSGVQNIELAKEAIIRSIEFLQPTDRAGAANFDTAGSWIANVQPVQDRRALQSLIATLRPGGGTDILAGMNLVAAELVQDPADRKHIILLTDGGANPAGLVELSEQIFEEADVTTSVIAIGAGSASFLDDMANAGGGNFYLIDNVAQIPTIFTQETVLATRSYIQEEEFFPQVTGISPILNAITDGSGQMSAPPLYGYVATTRKQTATTIMAGGEYQDPILAQWQYGLGRSVAFTSDATSRWSADWVNWEGYSRFWAQTVEWTITDSADSNVEMRVEMDGEEARVIVDAREEGGEFLNGAGLQMSLVDPGLDSQQVELQQVAPGRYEASFTPGSEGSYILRLGGGTGEVSVS
ncbi:MAG: VWA domain-containing protein, partial [Chloroflexota bacterium]